jgi:hypothetical protein
VVAATSPITFAAGTVAFDQSANNTTNDARYARLGAANAFTVGGHRITSEGAAIVPLELRAGPSVTSDVFVIANNAGGKQIYVDRYFGTNLRGTQIKGDYAGYSLWAESSTASVKTILARGAASQTANLQEWQNSAGTVQARVTASGSVGMSALQAADGNTVMVFAGGGRNFGILGVSPTYGGGASVLHIGNAATVPTSNPTSGGIMFVEAGALKWRGSSGTVTTIANA